MLDDDPEALRFQPENLIRVKPYDNANVEDNTLERITPLLVEISREGYDDIPGVLSQFRGMDADQIDRAKSLDDNWMVNGRFGVVHFGTGAE